MKKLILGVLGLVLLIAVSTFGMAATSQTVTLNITIEQSLWITVDSTNATDNVVDFPNTHSDDAMPVAATDTCEVTGHINYDDDWVITTAATETFNNGAGVTFPITELQFDVESGGYVAYNAVGGAAIAVGASTTTPGSDGFTVSYQLALAGNEVADTYHAQVTYDIAIAI